MCLSSFKNLVDPVQNSFNSNSHLQTSRFIFSKNTQNSCPQVRGNMCKIKINTFPQLIWHDCGDMTVTPTPVCQRQPRWVTMALFGRSTNESQRLRLDTGPGVLLTLPVGRWFILGGWQIRTDLMLMRWTLLRWMPNFEQVCRLSASKSLWFRWLRFNVMHQPSSNLMLDVYIQIRQFCLVEFKFLTGVDPRGISISAETKLEWKGAERADFA